MKPLLIVFFVVLIFASGTVVGQQTALSNYKVYFTRELRAWTKTIAHFSISTFTHTDTTAFEDLEYNDLTGLEEFYSIYKPALTFSPDSSKFIDIYSYLMNLERKGNRIVYSGGEVDQVITLCDVKRKKWTRILFCGASQRIQEVIWVNDKRFILVGSVQNENPSYLPVIYVGDIEKGIFLLFTSTDPKCIQDGNYVSSKIKRLNIREE